jgi:hypothetical protein
MIDIQDSTAAIDISDIELDGNLDALQIGGPWGDSGHQIACMGILLRNNVASETVRNVRSHHHGQDGVLIDGADGRAARSRFDNVTCDYNGRQGVSMVGGRGYDFVDCKFNKTGRSALQSGPCSGFDIEAEGGKLNRDITFTQCEFFDNVNCGLLADSGDSANVRVSRCTFVGATGWAAWPRMPGFRFDHCTFVGAICNVLGGPDPERAVQFRRCTFTDDPALGVNGRVYLQFGDHGPIADLNDLQNMLFDTCRFTLVGNAQLPWSTSAIYKDCTMSQRSPRPAHPRGTYLGRSVISGNVDLYSSRITGEVVVNGTRHSGIVWGRS